jgi:hypothetical protein
MSAAALIIFLAGMAAGWLLNDVLDRLDRARPEAFMTRPRRAARRPDGSSWRARAAGWRARLGRNHGALVGAIAVAFACAALIVGALNSRSAHDQNGDLARAAQHNAQVSSCQAAFNKNVVAALRARARLSDRRSAVLIAFISDLLGQPVPTSIAAAEAQQRRDRVRLGQFRAETDLLSEQLSEQQVPVLGGQCGTPTPVPSPART